MCVLLREPPPTKLSHDQAFVLCVLVAALTADVADTDAVAPIGVVGALGVVVGLLPSLIETLNDAGS
jgi:hypothetical protein